jgi:hypothetical protein
MKPKRAIWNFIFWRGETHVLGKNTVRDINVARMDRRLQ